MLGDPASRRTILRKERLKGDFLRKARGGQQQTSEDGFHGCIGSIEYFSSAGNLDSPKSSTEMIKSYQEGKTNGGSFLWLETKRIQDSRRNKRIEEAANKNPVASLSAN
jgi:hypothetical protein